RGRSRATPASPRQTAGRGDAGGRRTGRPPAPPERRRTASLRARVESSSSSHPRRLDPGHHGPQPLADFFDLMVGVTLAHGQELRAVGLVLQHPFASELARLDLAQDLIHLDLGLLALYPSAPVTCTVHRVVCARVT